MRRVFSALLYVLLVAILGYELWVIIRMITSHVWGQA
jgi:hypothetical protein